MENRPAVKARLARMNRLKSTLVVAAVAAFLALTVMGGGDVIAQGMKPLLVTPVLNAADRVQLLGPLPPSSDGCEAGTLPVRRVMADGTTVNVFSVPAGKILVLTDMEGIVSSDAVQWSEGDIAVLRATNGVPGGVLAPAQLTAYAPLNAAAAASGIISVGVHTQSGVFSGLGGAVCVSASARTAFGIVTADVEIVQLQGYLITE